MDAIVTFVVPVRHQDNARDWARLKTNLSRTISSISAQTNSGWRAVVIANHGADLPDLPPGFEAVRVDFPANPYHEQNGLNKETLYEAFRWDKGRRVLAGMLHNRQTLYYMIVDDDDFISRNIVAFVASDQRENGWKMQNGYIWSEGHDLLFRHDEFYNYCGTSLIIRSDLYNLPDRFEDASENYIKTMLGSHTMIAPILDNRGTPLKRFPFPGAIYRVGHVNAHSNSATLLRRYILNRYTLCRPLLFASNLSKMRRLTPALRAEFFGKSS